MSLTCSSQLNPYVDTPVVVTTMWTGPRGTDLMGSNTTLLGGTYQSSLVLMTLAPQGAGTYTCSALVLPNSTPYVTSTGTAKNTSIEGTL